MVTRDILAYLPIIVDRGCSIVDNCQVGCHTVSCKSLQIDSSLNTNLVLKVITVPCPLSRLTSK